MSKSSRFWLVTLSTLLVSTALFAMGMWQLDRAKQKQNISQQQRTTAPLELQGQWSSQHTLYLDNRQMQGKQGFFVITPLLLPNRQYVLVKRGWIARNFLDRKQLQPIETPSGTITLVARLLPNPQIPTFFTQDAFAEHPIVPFIDLAAIDKTLPNLTYQGFVQQIGPASEGLERQWDEIANGAEKHHGYAFQWFAMCATVLGLYLWFQWIKPRRHS